MSLNLYTEAGGIFGTHVTWADIEEEMQHCFGTEAYFGNDKTVENIGDGKGFLSRICLIKPDWQNKKSDEELPDMFVAKLCSLMAMQEFVAYMKTVDPNFGFPQEVFENFEIQAKKLHNAECSVYEHMGKVEHSKVPQVKIYHNRRFSEKSPLKGILLMEYKKDIHGVHLYDNLTVDQIKEAVRVAAKWTSMSLTFTDEDKAAFTQKPFGDLFKPMFTPDTTAQLLQQMNEFADGRLAPHGKELAKIVNPEGIYNFDFFDELADSLDMKRVLCHGDLWSTNVLWTKEKEQLHVAALIDFQTAHFGCPAVDICRLICATASGKDRREHFEEFIRYYYDQLIEELDGVEAPFNYEQLLESCKRFMPMGALMIIVMISGMFDRHFSTMKEGRDEALELALQKTEYLFEDLFHYHKRNLENAEKSE